MPLVVLAGKEYGTGSLRDWAAKGTLLLGVRAVIAESYERIHRSNLVGMGVLPLEFKPGENAEIARPHRRRDVRRSRGLADALTPRQDVTVDARARRTARAPRSTPSPRIDTPVEIDYYRNGGILQTVLRKLLAWADGRDGPTHLPRRGADGHGLAVPASRRAASGCSSTAGCSRATRRCASATGTRRPYDPASRAGRWCSPTPTSTTSAACRAWSSTASADAIYCTPPTRELAEVLLAGRGAPAGRGRRLPEPQGADPAPAGAAAVRRPRTSRQALKLFETVPLRPGARRSPALLASASATPATCSARPPSTCTVQRGRDSARACSSAATSAASTPCSPRTPSSRPTPTTWWSRAPTATARTPRSPVLDQLEGVLERTFARGGVLLIPAFAVGRAQQMIC